jgi:hypothetical protein
MIYGVAMQHGSAGNLGRAIKPGMNRPDRPEPHSHLKTLKKNDNIYMKDEGRKTLQTRKEMIL